MADRKVISFCKCKLLICSGTCLTNILYRVLLLIDLMNIHVRNEDGTNFETDKLNSFKKQRRKNSAKQILPTLKFHRFTIFFQMLLIMPRRYLFDIIIVHPPNMQVLNIIFSPFIRAKLRKVVQVNSTKNIFLKFLLGKYCTS